MITQSEALRLADAIERYNAGVHSQAIYEDYLQAAAELRRLQGENEALARDAYRYRWIRDGGQYLIEEDRGLGPMWPDAAKVDALVDREIAGG